MKKQITFIVGILLLLASCKDNDVNFTYSPTDPRAGESIKFTNTTEEGEEWSWNFGDGSTSTSKSPSKIYKKPGTYTVVLKVDDKASRTCTQTITVHDTIPAIGVSDSIVYYYQKVTLTADAYNPYNHSVSYQWELPESVTLLDGELDDQQIDVYFSKLGGQNVRCKLTLGETVYQLDSVINVTDTVARSLIMARSGNIMHQRIYEYGYEEAIAYPVAQKAITSPTGLIADPQNGIFIFNDDATAAGMLACYNIESGSTEIVLQNAAAAAGQGFSHGFLRGGTLYWTTGDCIYATAAQSRNISFTAGAQSRQFLASAASLGLSAGLQSAGILCHNGTMLFAYGAGVHRFTEGQTAVSSILADYTLTATAIDPTSQKLYFTTGDGLYVSNLNGEYTVQIDATADGKAICVDTDDNKLFFTTAEGVKEIPLVHSSNNSTQQTAVLVNNFTDVTALGLDTVLR